MLVGLTVGLFNSTLNNIFFFVSQKIKIIILLSTWIIPTFSLKTMLDLSQERIAAGVAIFCQHNKSIIY